MSNQDVGVRLSETLYILFIGEAVKQKKYVGLTVMNLHEIFKSIGLWELQTIVV